MKILLIGGTGTISMAVTKRLLEQGEDLTLINRGNRNSDLPETVKLISCDIHDESAAREALKDLSFDCVADFIAFTPEQVERDFRLFSGKTRQYIFISTAMTYQKPPVNYLITEGIPHKNPYSQYAQDKISCEILLGKHYREDGFPITIVRPSLTYDERRIPFGLQGKNGFYAVVKRMLEGKPVIIHGDGTSLWTVTHNSDFAVAFTGLIGNPHAIGEAVHITSDEVLTWNQIYQITADALGVELNAVHVSSEFLLAAGGFDISSSLLGDKAFSLVFDNSKIKRLVPGFSAKIRFDQGIKQSIAYIMNHPECQKDDPEFDIWCDRVIQAREAAIRTILDSK